MKISENIFIVDFSLYLEKEEILIISDLHIGFEESLNKQGILIPRFQYKKLIQRLKEILSKVKVKTIVINGDLKHEFGTISEQEWHDTFDLLNFLKEYNIILIKGNHDKILEPIAEKRNIKIVDSYSLNNILIIHGNKIISIKEKTIIIGHEHPAISFKERKDEVFKCFLKGKWKGKELIVMPSFNLVTQGTNIKKQKLLSPFLKNIKNFNVYIVEDKVYDFGKLKDL